MLAVISCISLLICILQIIALWKIFVKAGEKGWKSIIPIYNIYIMFKMTKTDNFGFYLGSSLVGSFMVTAGAAFDTFSMYGAVNGGCGTMLDIGGIILLLFSVVLKIKMYDNLSHTFGHGSGFTVLMVFFPVIAYAILAFSKDVCHSETLSVEKTEDFCGNAIFEAGPIQREDPSEKETEIPEE